MLRDSVYSTTLKSLDYNVVMTFSFNNNNNNNNNNKVQKFSSDADSPGGPGKRAVKRLWCGVVWLLLLLLLLLRMNNDYCDA